MNVRSTLEQELRAKQEALGVSFSTLRLTSAARELGILQQIEINHPSKLVKKKINTVFEDPLNKGHMIEAQVDHEYRVLLKDEEIVQHHQDQALALLVDKFGSVDALAKYLAGGSKRKKTAAKGKK